jgi:rhodanese-related sulfurtransferase
LGDLQSILPTFIHTNRKEEEKMSTSIMDMVAAAKGTVPAISPGELQSLIGQEDVLIVDVRDHPEVVETGKIKGALHVTRGMLEFCADEATPYHNAAFTRDKMIVLYCASGGRAALAGKALMDLGYPKVRNLGGFAGWLEATGPTDPA